MPWKVHEFSACILNWEFCTNIAHTHTPISSTNPNAHRTHTHISCSNKCCITALKCENIIKWICQMNVHTNNVNKSLTPLRYVYLLNDNSYALFTFCTLYCCCWLLLLFFPLFFLVHLYAFCPFFSDEVYFMLFRILNSCLVPGTRFDITFVFKREFRDRERGRKSKEQKKHMPERKWNGRTT